MSGTIPALNDQPIGVFDSGFGGLTVARALIDLLPDEQIIYVGDSQRYPYGPRPAEEIRRYAREITKYLVAQENVKMVVVACNTASSVALEELRVEFDVPVLGVIEPGLRSAVRASRNGRIGVIGTVGTVASGSYQRCGEQLGIGDAKVFCYACPGFVEFVERGEFDSDQVHVLAERLLGPLVDLGIDTLLLGCTHYPFIARTISDVMGRDVLLVSSAEETAFDVREILLSTSAATTRASRKAHRFISSGDPEWFVEVGTLLLGSEIDRVERVIFGTH